MEKLDRPGWTIDPLAFGIPNFLEQWTAELAWAELIWE